MSHLLVTNDFPPKVGGIQSYLWELWRRFEPGSFAVLTASSHPDAHEFDRLQAADGHQIHRYKSKVLLPTPDVVKATRRLASEVGASMVVIDPVLPLGLMGPSLGLPYAVVLHGAEMVAPGNLPVTRTLVREVLARAELAICGGEYVAEAVVRVCGRRSPELIVVSPGVDTLRFRPLDGGERLKARRTFGLPDEGLVLLSLSRLVPRKGMDVAIEAAARLVPSFGDLTVVIGGDGRDRGRLRRLVVSTGSPVRMLGRVDDDAMPELYGLADAFVMMCRDRWLGLEQEGFGIVFLEAAACGVPQLAGRSGGAAEAVVDGETGFVVDDPSNVGDVAAALRRLLSDSALRSSMGEAGRLRAVESYDYGDLSLRLGEALRQVEG